MDSLILRMAHHHCHAGYIISDKPKSVQVGYVCKLCGTVFRSHVGFCDRNDLVIINQGLDSYDGRLAIAEIGKKD